MASCRTRAEQLAAGDAFAAATDDRGRYWTWGDAGYGQSGTGESLDHLSPARSPILAGPTAVTAGRTYALAAKTDGPVWSTGQNASGPWPGCPGPRHE